MTLDGTIKRYIDNAEYERIRGSLQGCLDFKQIAEWLKDYKRLLEQEAILDKLRTEITNDIHKCNNTDMAFGMQHTLDIIDKYKRGKE